MDTLRVLVELCTSCAPTDGFHFWNLHDEALGDLAQPIGLGERDAGIELQVDEQRAFIERRQERAWEEHCADGRQQ